MQEYFTVDRGHKFNPGMVLDADALYDDQRFWSIEGMFTKQDLTKLVEELYPGGLTEHGKKYLLDECLIIKTPSGPAPAVPHIPMVELVFELVRRIEFPELISRYQAIFGWETIEAAEAFKESFGTDESTIYVVNCKESIKLDMSLLYLGGSTIGSIWYARKYWCGEPGKTPNWEVLMKPPVTVIKIIEQ